MTEEEKKQRAVESHRRYYEKNKEKAINRAKSWRKANAQARAEYEKEYYKQNKDRRISNSRQNYKDNRLKRLEQRKKYREENKERIAQDKKQYYKKHKEQVASYKKTYARENKAKVNARAARRRAAKVKATPSWLNDSHKNQIELFYEAAASYQAHVDHIVPLLGKNVCGLHVPWNLQLLKVSDNIVKGNRLTEDSYKLAWSVNG